MKKYTDGKYVEIIIEEEVFPPISYAEPTPEERQSIIEDAFAELCGVIFNG